VSPGYDGGGVVTAVVARGGYLYVEPRPTPAMPLDDRREDLLVAVALTEFSVHYEQADPDLSSEAWQLADDRLVDHDVGPAEAVGALEIGQ